MDMNKKKTAILAGVLGAGILAASARFYRSVQEEHQKARALEEVRAFFGEFGPIATVFIYEEDSTGRVLSGGVVMEDGRVYSFVNEAGTIVYEEEEHAPDSH